MSKILAVDYGNKRTGLAITDELQIIASPLETVETAKLLPYLKDLIPKENIKDIVVGLPMRAHGVPGELEVSIQHFIGWLRNNFEYINIHRQDESYTSIRAAEALVQGGMKKKKRQKKGALDLVSAALILRAFMERN